jgi:hypothetical protein
VRIAAAALIALLTTAAVASADLYRGHATSGDAGRPPATARTATDRTARIQSGAVAIPCANGARLRVRLDVRVRLRADHTFLLRRTERLTLETTGRATSREEYRGAVSRVRARLRFTDTVKGARTTCRADVRFTLKRVT